MQDPSLRIYNREIKYYLKYKRINNMLSFSPFMPGDLLDECSLDLLYF